MRKGFDNKKASYDLLKRTLLKVFAKIPLRHHPNPSRYLYGNEAEVLVKILHDIIVNYILIEQESQLQEKSTILSGIQILETVRNKISNAIFVREKVDIAFTDIEAAMLDEMLTDFFIDSGGFRHYKTIIRKGDPYEYRKVVKALGRRWELI